MSGMENEVSPYSLEDIKGIVLMISEGQNSPLVFPRQISNLENSAQHLWFVKLPGRYEDLLVCMISSQLNDCPVEKDKT